MATPKLYLIESIPPEHKIGAKAEQILWLVRQGFQVPKTYVLPFDTETACRQDQQGFKRQLLKEIETVLDLNNLFAVRSSANVEDGTNFSFAGQFASLLNVRGGEAISEAVCNLYESLISAPPDAYIDRVGAQGVPLQMAVIIQEMVKAKVSGVSFSKNPVTGLDEVIVEAIEGNGAALLQGGQTPDRWVSKWGEWTHQPENTTIDLNLIAEVVTLTKEGAAAFGAPVDLEWVFGDGALYWVQIRPITTAENISIYSNRIAREVLPGLIKPLVWSINTPLVNGAWVKLFTELIGPNNIRPEDLARPFYYRAYFNMKVIGQFFELLGFPPESLELLLGVGGGTDRPTFKPNGKTFRHVPRMLRALVDKLRYQRVVEQALPHLRAEFDKFAQDEPAALPPDAVLEKIEALTKVSQEAAYFNIVILLLMSIYNAILKWQLTKLGVDFARFDLALGLGEIKTFDPNVHIGELHSKFQQLSSSAQEIIVSTDMETWGANQELADFSAVYLQFLRQFGHLSDSGNDFSSRPWREDPALVMMMITHYAVPDRLGDSICWEDLGLAPHQKLLTQTFYHRARQYRYYREAISSLYTFGYGLFRQYFLALGALLNLQGLIEDQNDIFYLTYDEVKKIVHGDGEGSGIQGKISRRKKELAAAEDISVPDLIYGDEAPPPKAMEDSQPRMTGIPSARGYYRGPVTVIKRIQDFDRIKTGDVLVIPYSDVSWTPLFGKAGGVIAESGGLLSHSSIVAREFNIPCVVSVNGACQLQDGLEVAVDGYNGEITILDTTN